MAESATPGITATIRSLLGDARYADLTITSGTRKWRVHKAIVCTRSDFFAKLVDRRVAESKGDTIDLREDHPNAIAAVLRFLYTDSFSDLAHEEEDGQEWKRLPMNVRVYEIADKYGLKKLANLALSKFKASFRSESSGFLEAVRLIYMEDTEPLAPLRANVMEYLTRHGKELVAKEEFQRVAISVPLFAAALLKQLFRLKKEGELEESKIPQEWELTCFICPKKLCRKRFAVELDAQTSFLHCPACGNHGSGSLWRPVLQAST